MPDDQKDRLGDKLRDVERGREDAYFQKRDQELLRKLREQRAREEARMRCPKCGSSLEPRVQQGITVEMCPDCGGLWLDQGEFEELARREREIPSWVAFLWESIVGKSER